MRVARAILYRNTLTDDKSFGTCPLSIYKYFPLSFCPAPLSVPHITTKDTRLYGYDVPKDTILFPNVYSACYDPKYWENPELFNPNRFIANDGKHRKLDAYVPFSAGTTFLLDLNLTILQQRYLVPVFVSIQM